MSIESIRDKVREAKNNIPLFVEGKASATDIHELSMLLIEIDDLQFAINSLSQTVNEEIARLRKETFGASNTDRIELIN